MIGVAKAEVYIIIIMMYTMSIVGASWGRSLALSLRVNAAIESVHRLIMGLAVLAYCQIAKSDRKTPEE